MGYRNLEKEQKLGKESEEFAFSLDLDSSDLRAKSGIALKLLRNFSELNV